MTLGIATDDPYVNHCFWSMATITDWWDQRLMRTQDDQQSVQKFCMKKATFLKLCEQLVPMLQHHNSSLCGMRVAISVQKQVAVTTWKLATSFCYRSIANQFGAGKSTVTKVVAEASEATLCYLLKGGGYEQYP